MNYFEYEKFDISDKAAKVAEWLREHGDDFITIEGLNLNSSGLADNLETLAYVLRGRVE
jgi:hypothetical protein|nr:MAG TPA: hypothetical protein [Caudoviricetes sp.]